VTVFILPPSYAALEQRLRGRGADDEATVQRRLQNAREEMSLYREYDYAIVNDELPGCVEALKTVIRAARLRVSRMEDTARAILETFEA
jgi:guanylate kinase